MLKQLQICMYECFKDVYFIFRFLILNKYIDVRVYMKILFIYICTICVWHTYINCIWIIPFIESHNLDHTLLKWDPASWTHIYISWTQNFFPWHWFVAGPCRPLGIDKDHFGIDAPNSGFESSMMVREFNTCLSSSLIQPFWNNKEYNKSRSIVG